MVNKPFTPEEFKNIYSRVPRLCVDLIIKTDKGILLTLRKNNGYEGLWHLPGSTVYFQEPAEKAVTRVANEELGIEAEIKKFLGYIEYPSEVQMRGFGYSVSLAFLCEAKTIDIKLDDQATSFGFFQELPQNMVEEQKKFVSGYLNGQSNIDDKSGD